MASGPTATSANAAGTAKAVVVARARIFLVLILNGELVYEEKRVVNNGAAATNRWGLLCALAVEFLRVHVTIGHAHLVG